MDMMKVHQHARALYDAHGDKAQAEAARNAKKYEDAGDEAEAEIWRAIQRAISEMRGPNQS
ncbi:hypothetical protein [Aestuariicoccus sp. MJ-SS9]|uniref:hypothetical protein n=1 Tax=Aestuariicoccus sp. MJ-SS9 TaxID=3079855 RepID=UPI00290A9C82|nr:hypothetical protein [Aestuariicoccus sp. MJ-SS9]MDU8913413.1 hypothetical protein [Aestuariicoccus sp. MJ-SS9]